MNISYSRIIIGMYLFSTRSMKIEVNLRYARTLKLNLCLKLITSENIVHETQFKNFFISWKSHVSLFIYLKICIF